MRGAGSCSTGTRGVEVGGVGARRSGREATCRTDFPLAGSEGELWGILCQLGVAKRPV